MTHEQAVSTFASERYLLDEMTEPERGTFEEHYFSCSLCADDLRAGALMREGARAGLLGDRARDNVSDMAASTAWRRKTGARRWYQSTALPWAAAATLAVVAGYQAVVGPSQQPFSHPTALAPTTLRPASRGQEPVVAVSPASVVVFAVDVSSSVAGTELPYTINTAQGAVVATGKVSSPQPGTPLLMLVPASELKSPGRYILSIAGAEYPFAVVAQ